MAGADDAIEQFLRFAESKASLNAEASNDGARPLA
jgi:hypothetical protein